MITERKIEDELIWHALLKSDLTEEQLVDLKRELEWIENGGAILDGVVYSEELQKITFRRRYQIITPEELKKIRDIIERCNWTKLKPKYDYIDRDNSSLCEEEYLYFVNMLHRSGIPKRMESSIIQYVQIDGFKYWTTSDSNEDTAIIYRTKE